MTILFISMPSIHAQRWIENLYDSQHNLYWFDVLNKGKLVDNENLTQIIDWQKRKIPYIKGEFFLQKKLPKVYNLIHDFLEITIGEQLTKIIQEIKPDVVHSFEMQSCSYPILKTLNKFPKIKWIYSCWGSDLYYYQNFKNHNSKIKAVLKRVDLLQTDCQRDIQLAKSLGYSGICLPIIPGGTGFDLQKLEKFQKPIADRKIILVKGYEHNFGRAINVIKALQLVQNDLNKYEIIIFAAHKVVINFVNDNNLHFKIFDRNSLNHHQVLELMGQSLIYIGNSISDGIPNTLLEAIVMGAFPIQSNPGGATQEIIENDINGLLIKDSENISDISNLILKALSDGINFKNAYHINVQIAETRLDYLLNREKVVAIY